MRVRRHQALLHTFDASHTGHCECVSSFRFQAEQATAWMEQEPKRKRPRHKLVCTIESELSELAVVLFLGPTQTSLSKGS
jgi:hypothetical protein